MAIGLIRASKSLVINFFDNYGDWPNPGRCLSESSCLVTSPVFGGRTAAAWALAVQGAGARRLKRDTQRVTGAPEPQ
jgi:hypothetical protein